MIARGAPCYYQNPMSRTARTSWDVNDLARLLEGIGGDAQSIIKVSEGPNDGCVTSEEIAQRVRAVTTAPSFPAAGEDRLSLIRSAFARLPPSDRAVTWLWAVERLSPSSIAGPLGWDPAKVELHAATLVRDLCKANPGQGGCSLLIAEDERITALELREALEEMGHRVVAVAPSAGQAISAASLHEPTLALVDIRLKGGTDGVSAAREIQDALGVPVIVMTAFTDQATRAASIRPYGFLAKPWSDADLRGVLDEALVRVALERRA